jgi:hypothetical protein
MNHEVQRAKPDPPCCDKTEEIFCDKVCKVLANHIIEMPPSIERSTLVQKLCTIHPKFLSLVSLLH